MPWLLLLCLAAISTGGAFAQPEFGFVSIDCGLPGETGFLGNNTKLYFSTDAGFIDAGSNHNISFDYKDPLASQSWNTLRSFPNGTRNCYTIPLPESGLKYLLRGKFWYGNYDRLKRLPIFDLYIGVNFWTTVKIPEADSGVLAEVIVVVPDNYVQVCLVNTGFGTPFINTLELRPLKNKLYPFANETQGLLLVQRFNFGPSDPNTFLRYPDDPHDRYWRKFVDETADWDEIKTDLNVDNDGDPFATPTVVAQTAITSRNKERKIEFSLLDLPSPLNHTSLRYISIMHFSELQLLPGNTTRQYNINVNGELLVQAYKPEYLYSRSVYSTEPTEYGQYNVSINALANSTFPPMINAIELFSVISTTNLSTDAQDASAIMAIKRNYKVHKNWMGDPCFPNSLVWDGLNCSYVVKPPVIISVNLSFSGLDGFISPSFANIKNVQSLDLSSNNLIGSIPDELSQLPSLTLLFVKQSAQWINSSRTSQKNPRWISGSKI